MAEDAKGHGSEKRGGVSDADISQYNKIIQKNSERQAASSPLARANAPDGPKPGPLAVSAASHQAGVQSVNANPQPGTQAWLDAKRGGPRWTWQDATGTQREGYMHTFSDRGGTDVSYFMHRDPGGQLDVVSGQRLKDAHTIPDHTVKK